MLKYLTAIAISLAMGGAASAVPQMPRNDNPGAVLAAYEAECLTGQEEACNEWIYAATEYAVAGRISRDEAQAIFQKACERDSAHGCHAASAWFERTDTAQYRALLIRACDLSRDRIVAISCWHLGQSFEHVSPVDLRLARWAYEKDCALQNGCHHFALMLRDGRGGAKDEAGAVAYFEQACANMERAASCFEAATMIEQGRGSPVDAERAGRLREQACALAHSAAEKALCPPPG